MKIAKIRKKAKWYEVWYTSGLFGNFGKYPDCTVLAFSPKHATERAQKRGVGIDQNYFRSSTVSCWALFQVKEKDKPFNFRHLYYFK